MEEVRFKVLMKISPITEDSVGMSHLARFYILYPALGCPWLRILVTDDGLCSRN